MKILFLTTYSPLETSTGALQRTHFVYSALQKLGRVDVAHFVYGATPSSSQKDGTGTIYSINLQPKGLIDRPYVPIESKNFTFRLKEFVNLDEYDVVVSRYIRPVMKIAIPKHVKVIVDYDDAFYTIPWRSITSLNMLFRELVKKFNDVSVRTILQFNKFQHSHYFFVSERDRSKYPKLHSSILPNIPLLPSREPEFKSPDHSTLMFVGLMTYRPNAEAIERFIERCWPKIRVEIPDVKLVIAGRASQDDMEKWNLVPGCNALGFVDDLQKLYENSSVSIVPIWSGGGSNIKALEAFMYGRPVVATEYSYDGLRQYIHADGEILVASDDHTFAEHCIYLLKNKVEAQDFAHKGYLKIKQNLSFDNFSKILAESITSVL